MDSEVNHGHRKGNPMQEEFRPAIEHALDMCISRFGSRLLTVVLSGSVAFGEAIIGASDVDWFAFIEDDLSDDDMLWREEAKDELEEKYPVVSEFGLGLFPIDKLRQEESWRFIIKHNSIRLYGEDMISRLESEGVMTPLPTKEYIKSRLSWIESMWQSACDDSIPEMLFKMPHDPYQATRKIARYFVLVEGAYLLMINGHFKSFQRDHILGQLRNLYPQWDDVYDLVERVSINPQQEQVIPAELTAKITPFMRWMIENIKDA